MIRGLTASAVAAVALLLILETTARVYLFGMAGLDPRKVASLRDFRSTAFVRKSEEPLLGFEGAKNVSGFFKLVPFSMNSQGLRDIEYAVEKPPDTFRVAVLGASFTLPAGVRIEDAYHSVLEERFSAEFAPRRVEFVNFALGAYHPLQMLVMLESRALQYDPDLVLVGTTPLSMPLLLTDPTPVERGKSYQLRPPTNPFWKSFFVDLVKLRTGGLEPELRPDIRRGHAKGPTILKALGSFSRTHGIPVVVARLEFDAAAAPKGDRVIAKAASTAGVYFVDTRERFAGMDPRRLWIHPMDPHPNAEAHALFAEVLSNFLRENGLLDGRDGLRDARRHTGLAEERGGEGRMNEKASRMETTATTRMTSKTKKAR